MQKTCPVTGLTFEPSTQEMALRRKLGIEGEPLYHPVFRFMQLGAFWWHWNLYKRKDDRTGKQIISVFAEDCPYPVWHKDDWMKEANPPVADPDLSQPIFPQMWELFRKSPIPHNMGVGSVNCEFTDDWWYGKNCYLCHSGAECEDLRYCYRVVKLHHSQFCVFSFESEYCIDLINCHTCNNVRFAYNAWQCSDSAFLYDCRNCSECMFCSNLRNKKYCFWNEQMSEEEYKKRVAAWDFKSREAYERGKREFDRMMRERSWHRALFIDRSENANGNYLDQCKNCTGSFFLSGGFEDTANNFRGHASKDCLDSVGIFESELVYDTASAQDKSYDVRHCFNLMQCKWMEYSANCFQCEHVFGCCGLVGKKYCIFNKQWQPDAYEVRKTELIDAMKRTGEYGRFFPGYFAPTPYEETLSGFHWPLPREEAVRLGFRVRENEPARTIDALDAEDVPDHADEADAELPSKVFWDDEAKRPFRIEEADMAFSREMNVPLPYTYYARRLQENFHRIPFDGMLREIACGKCEKNTQTSWPEEFDGRILCEECYLKEVY